MATERSSLLYGADGSATASSLSTKTVTFSRTAQLSAIAALLGVAGVAAWSSESVSGPQSVLRASRLGVSATTPASINTEPDTEQIQYPDDALGWVRGEIDLTPAFVACAAERSSDSSDSLVLVKQAYHTNDATCVSIKAAIENSQCVRSALDDDCVQNAFVKKIVSDGCADGADANALNAPAWLDDTGRAVLEACPSFPATDTEDGNYTNAVSSEADASLGKEFEELVSTRGFAIHPASPHRFATAAIVAAKRETHVSRLGAEKGQPDYHGPWQGYIGVGLLPVTPPTYTVAAGNNPVATFQLLTQVSVGPFPNPADCLSALHTSQVDCLLLLDDCTTSNIYQYWQLLVNVTNPYSRLKTDTFRSQRSAKRKR